MSEEWIDEILKETGGGETFKDIVDDLENRLRDEIRKIKDIGVDRYTCYENMKKVLIVLNLLYNQSLQKVIDEIYK